MIHCVGYKDNRYLLKESERGVLLNFIGADAGKFAQFKPPKKPRKVVDFSLTVEYLQREFPGLLPPVPGVLVVENNGETAVMLTYRPGADGVIDAVFFDRQAHGATPEAFARDFAVKLSASEKEEVYRDLDYTQEGMNQEMQDHYAKHRAIPKAGKESPDDRTL